VFVQDATNFSVPEYVDVMSEMKITPGCTYEIVVESNPNDGKRKASLNYTVPGRSSSSYICHGVGPLVDPFRSHASRSLFKGLP
jgi:hypothetical protein